MQRRLYIDEAHTALDTLRVAVFFYLCSVSLGDALTTAAVRPFLKSTRNGLLKNVQDGISRSREIQKIKVATVLRDTL